MYIYLYKLRTYRSATQYLYSKVILNHAINIDLLKSNAFDDYNLPYQFNTFFPIKYRIYRSKVIIFGFLYYSVHISRPTVQIGGTNFVSYKRRAFQNKKESLNFWKFIIAKSFSDILCSVFLFLYGFVTN